MENTKIESINNNYSCDYGNLFRLTQFFENDLFVVLRKDRVIRLAENDIFECRQDAVRSRICQIACNEIEAWTDIDAKKRIELTNRAQRRLKYLIDFDLLPSSGGTKNNPLGKSYFFP